MKIIKKIAAIMLSVMMVLGMCSVVGAEGASGTGTSGTTGSIKISNAIVKQEYKIYRILELESYDKTNGLYSYKPNSSWKAFFDDKSDPKGAGSDYITVDDNGYARWKGAETDERKREFAKLALEYAKDKKISENAKATAKASGEGVTTTELTFPGLQLGYYLVDSSAGALCSLDTTNLDATIQEKNGVPSVKKEVQEDSRGNSIDAWGNENTADIGQTVNFKTTITAQPGAQSYVLHDKMSEGLTFAGSVSVTKGEQTLEAPRDYSLVTRTSTPAIEDACTFEIEFKESFCDTLAKDDQIIVTYSATLNEKAKIGKTTGNTNTTYLKYGDSSKTQDSTTTTYTFEIPVLKYTNKGTPATETPLANANFKLSKDENGKTPIYLVDITKTGDSDNIYRVAKATEDPSITKITEIITPDSGKLRIQGLDEGIYYLTETKQPDGYNILKEAIRIDIDKDGNIKYASKSETLNPMTSGGDVKVLNQTGSILPSTGGMGTTLFYIFGAILVIGSGVVLITKKRMK